MLLYNLIQNILAADNKNAIPTIPTISGGVETRAKLVSHSVSTTHIPLKMILILGFMVFGLLSACQPVQPTSQGFRATVPAAVVTAPIYTDTPSLTPTMTLTPSHTPSQTFTPSQTHTLTPSYTITPSPTRSLTPSQTFTPAPTLPLITLTAPSVNRAPNDGTPEPAEFTRAEGWSCVEFPCEDDLNGWIQRIRVPSGYTLAHVGKFPANVQPLQIVYGRDGRLYATAWENGTLTGAVYVMNPDGTSERYTQATFYSPVGLAFQPGTDVLYLSARLTPTSGGGVWRVLPNGMSELVIDTLPCCLEVVGNQPNGMIFGQDGYLYLGVGSLTDRAEPANPQRQRYAELHPLEASILRIQPHTGLVEVYAGGIRNPYDVAFDSQGQFYATDNGMFDGIGDRILRVNQGAFYGFPFWRNRGCLECPPTDFNYNTQPDLLPLPDYTLPRGITVYTGTQFPASVFDDVFVTFWNAAPNGGGQQVVRIDPQSVPSDPEDLAAYAPSPFITGLIRPTDVIVAPDGSLVVADFVYGHVWRVRYGDAPIVPTPANPLFVTSTPRP